MDGATSVPCDTTRDPVSAGILLVKPLVGPGNITHCREFIRTLLTRRPVIRRVLAVRVLL
jgi:hypothetical protein